MNIKKINEHKIRITLNTEELDIKKLNVNNFSNFESQAIILDILNKVEKEIGFSTKNYELLIETALTEDEYYILTITRTSYKNKSLKKNNLIPKRINQHSNSKKIIVSLKDFEHFENISSKLNNIYNDIDKILVNSSLYKYNNSYYLFIYLKEVLEIKKLTSAIIEYSNSLVSSELIFKKILEYGDVIIENNAINSYKK